MNEPAMDPSVSPHGDWPARIDAMIAGFDQMPTFIGQIASSMRDPNIDLRRLADQIRLDPGVTANVLKVANSARFGSQHRIASIQEAVVRMGLRPLFQTVMAVGMAPRLAKPLPGYGLQPREMLTHALWTALAAEELCRIINLKAPDMLFTAGLLHDMGKVVLAPAVAEEELELRRLVVSFEMPFNRAEREVFGRSHAEIGGELIESWGLPEALSAAARWHHTPSEATVCRQVADIVHIAEFTAYAEGIGGGLDGLTYRLDRETIGRLGITIGTVERVICRTLDQVREMEASLAS